MTTNVELINLEIFDLKIGDKTFTNMKVVGRLENVVQLKNDQNESVTLIRSGFPFLAKFDEILQKPDTNWQVALGSPGIIAAAVEAEKPTPPPGKLIHEFVEKSP